MYHKTHWTVDKIRRRLELIEDEKLVYRRTADLPPFRWIPLPDPMTLPQLGVDVDRSDWATIEPGTYWGQRFSSYILSTTFQAPADWDKGSPIALYLPLGIAGDFSHPESLAYIDGEPYAAADRHHQEFLLPAKWCDGKPHQLDLHTWTGLWGEKPVPDIGGLYMKTCKVVQIDQPLRNFVVTARVALETAEIIDDNNVAKGYLLNALDDAFKILDTREPFGDDIYASVPAAHAALKAGIAKAGPPLDVEVIGTGHAHIDVAWLWTLGVTRRKSGRTFHTVMRLMEQFPFYHFTQSQPQLYDYVRQDYPELFEAIKARVAEKRWEPIGGMWVEADCNLSGSESLARQFLLGRTFFREHFGPGADTKVLWLPDVFGYAWNLPQLIKEAGLEYFFTIKIGWSQYNRLPYDSFWWQGLDGTKVLTHFSTTPDFGAFASTYNAMVEPKPNLGTWQNFQQKELQHTLLMSFGYGDGGGGPTREMLENLREMEEFPALPKMRAASVKEFYEKMEEEAGSRLPTWNGELYLELHRGTYTTQSRNKRANRKSEFVLHDAEFLAAMAGQLNPDFNYPQARLNKAWELVCLNQFHDIIPGSSIGPVYVESQQQYAEIRAMAESVIDAAIDALPVQGDQVLVVNPTGFARNDLAFLAGALPAGTQLENVAVQRTSDGVWIDAGELSPFSANSLALAKGSSKASGKGSLIATPTLLENDYIRVELNADGDITRLYDKTHAREVLPEGALANQFQAFEDRPINWDAWDVDIFLPDKMWHADAAQSVTVVEDGPLHATLEIKRRILHSDYTQRISLSYNSPRLDVVTDIDWRERHIFLKVAFPVDVFSPTATYEIQWGNTERPTHHNTSWDWARFETAAQKWVDLSEGDYGVSLLNDCKYGHDIKDNVMRISLLRSTTVPDWEADQGAHRFAYSLLPHAGRWDATTVNAAYALNDPLLARVVSKPGTAQAASQSFITCDAPNVVVETIKRAEDGNGIIVRIYETQRKRTAVTLTTAFPVETAVRANLLEEEKTAVAVDGNTVHYNIRPYEIATLRIVPA